MGLLASADQYRAESLRQHGRVYRPVMAAQLTVPIAGNRQQRLDMEASTDVVTLDVRPKAIRIERNDHNHADTCSLVLDWTEAGVDARILDDATAEVHIANADDKGNWIPSDATVRFCGIVKEVNSSRPNEEAAEVTLELMDYTALFLAAKPFGSSGIPALTMRLAEAWQTIVAQTPGAEIFADAKRLVFQDVDPNLVIGKGVSERFRQLANVQTKPETDAWAVWQQCVGMLGLLSYIEKDRCIVTTATNYYTEQDAPKLIWGKNIESWHENRVSALAKKGIAISSYDPLTLRVVEAYWPPIGDPLVTKKRARAKKVLSTDQIRQREERDYFTFPGVTDLDVLTDIAQRVWEERSRQELEGSVRTQEMWVETEQHGIFDLLDLKAGETVRVEVEPGQKQLLQSLGSDTKRAEFLLERGYSEGAAALIIANMKNFADLDCRFLTKRIGIEMELTPTSGSFGIDVDYVNRIEIDGSAK